jgi:hypothetical protein
MRNAFNRFAASVTAVAMASSMLLSAAPVHAAEATSIADTMSRQTTSTYSTHVVTMTLGGATAGTVILTYPAAFTAFTFTSGTCTSGSVANNGTALNIVNVTLTGCTAGTLTINFTGINGTSAASNSVAITGTASVTGSYAVPLVDSDQVTVTATVAPSITFDIDTDMSPVESATPYTVALGTITTSDGRVSGATDGINFIWLDIATNATGGAVITVSSTNASLKSTSVPGDTIPSSTATQANGTANYGLCSVSTSATSGTMTAVAPYASTCAANSETNAVGSVTVSPQAIYNTASDPIGSGKGKVAVNAAISAITVAHSDYTDILKFIATGTF